MRKIVFLLLGAILCTASMAQNPATVFTIPNDTILLPCGTTCTSINVTVPHIRQTTDYVVTNPAYLPYAYSTPGGTEEMILYDDDQWSEIISFPFAFSFCFYGTSYNSLLMGSNSALTFDITRAGDGSGYAIDPGGTIPNLDYAPSMIFGPYHDIDPSLSSPNLKLEWRVEGVAPKRRWIASYNDVPYFGSGCTTPRATHQIVLYENTGVIEVYIKDKPFCVDWNDGLSILGVQDQTRTKAVAAAGKNATEWGAAAMDSVFRFVPYGGAPMFRRAELLINNVVVSTTTTDTATSAPGELNINFPNVCPTADSTAYEIRVYYGSCSNPALEVSFSDTVYVKRSTLSATATSTNATCTENGTITVTPAGSSGTVQYSINGGNTYQSSNVFTNLQPGSYTVMVSDGGTCPVTLDPITIAITGSVTVEAGPNETICNGQSITRAAVGNATSYSWSPSIGVNNTAVAETIFTPQTTTTYTVTATTGNCVATDAFTITVAPGATVNAGPDASIVTGQSYTMLASGSAGTYVWTPSTGLSSTSVLNPSASPQVTTTYTLEVTTPAGCKATDEMTLTVVEYCIRPMEAFTPNGDGINDFWLVTSGNCLKSAKAQVFNRYGAKVFESNNYQNNWQGTYEGKPLPDGTYYFVISYELLTGKKEYLKGNVTILR